MAKLDDYRRGIENATIREELASSKEIAQLWRHIRDSYEYLLAFDEQADPWLASENGG